MRIVALTLSIAGLFLLGRAARVGAMEHYVETQTYEDLYYVPPNDWLPVMSLGHHEALADLLWLRALIYFGDEIVHRGDVSHALDYAGAMIHLDPRFRKAYLWAGTAGMYSARQVSVPAVQASIEFLKRGAAEFPDDGELAWDLGASLVFELVPHLDDPEEKERARAEGVEHLQAAARLGGGPPWLVLTNATQLRRLGRTEQAIRHLEEMYGSVDDESVRAQIRLELEQLRSRAFAEALERTHRELEARRLATLPYVDPTLFLFLDPAKDATADD